MTALGACSEKNTKNYNGRRLSSTYSLHLKKKRLDDQKKKDHNLDAIILAYDPKKKAFKIGQEYCKVRKSDIELIFGICDGKTKINVKKGLKVTKTSFINRAFPDADQLTVNLMKKALLRVVSEKHITFVHDTVRILCLILMATLFYCPSGHAFSWGYVRYVENLKLMDSYDWSGLILHQLTESLNSKSKQPQKVLGCIILLLYWFCEHCTTVEEALKSRQQVGEESAEEVQQNTLRNIPRCTKWILQNLNSIVISPMLQNLKFIYEELEPTMQEIMKIPCVKDTKEKDGDDESDDIDFEHPSQELRKSVGDSKKLREEIGSPEKILCKDQNHEVIEATLQEERHPEEPQSSTKEPQMPATDTDMEQYMPATDIEIGDKRTIEPELDRFIEKLVAAEQTIKKLETD